MCCVTVGSGGTESQIPGEVQAPNLSWFVGRSHLLWWERSITPRCSACNFLMSTRRLVLPMWQDNETLRYQMELSLINQPLILASLGASCCRVAHSPTSREMAALSWTAGGSLDLSWHLTCSWHFLNLSLELPKLPDDMTPPPSSLPCRWVAGLPGACLKAAPPGANSSIPYPWSPKPLLLPKAPRGESFARAEPSVPEPGPDRSSGVGIWAGGRVAGAAGRTWQHPREKARAGNWEQSPHTCQWRARRETSCSDGQPPASASGEGVQVPGQPLGKAKMRHPEGLSLGMLATLRSWN